MRTWLAGDSNNAAHSGSRLAPRCSRYLDISLEIGRTLNRKKANLKELFFSCLVGDSSLPIQISAFLQFHHIHKKHKPSSVYDKSASHNGGIEYGCSFGAFPCLEYPYSSEHLCYMQAADRPTHYESCSFFFIVKRDRLKLQKRVRRCLTAGYKC